MYFSEYDIECINNAKDFIDADKARHHTIPEIASYAGISRTRLKTGFKQLFGMGLYHYLQEQRLQKGKYLIENTNKTMKQISYSLGYKYVNNFSAAFKKDSERLPINGEVILPEICPPAYPLRPFA